MKELRSRFFSIKTNGAVGLWVEVHTNPPIPTLDEVRRIVNLSDPVLRNLHITQCYHELAAVLAWRTGMAANWCTFATWASKQAGQTIRKEDLARLLESRLKRSSSTMHSAERVAATAGLMGANPANDPQEIALSATTFKLAIDRASDAVSRGNKKVFEEIGYEFARFYQTCLRDQTPDLENAARFCEDLRRGEPPEGQDYLRQAFLHYYQALFEKDAKIRAELIFLANIEIGYHEQTRLQPEIAESLDAGLISSVQFTRLLLAALFPFNGLIVLTQLYLRRLLRNPTRLDLAIRSLLAAARSHMRQTITEAMMTITLASGVRLRLGKDLGMGFPDTLKQITNLELRHFLEMHDPTQDSTIDSGALDWAELPDRLHFIVDLFRCCQENLDLFEPPFTPEQVDAFKAGRRPEGRL